jgi:hypothetical protein
MKTELIICLVFIIILNNVIAFDADSRSSLDRATKDELESGKMSVLVGVSDLLSANETVHAPPPLDALNASEKRSDTDLHTTSSSSSKFEYTNRLALNYIWPTVPIGFLILGTIANILSIIIFRRREMRKYSSFCYFAYLNIVNLAVLYVTLIRVIMDFNFLSDIRSFNLFTCKVHVFLTYFLTYLSSLLFSSISIDRVISVMFLHKAKLYCTPQVAFKVTIGLVIFNFLLASHFLIFESGYNVYNLSHASNSTHEEVDQLTSTIRCEPRENTNYGTFVNEVWKVVDIGMLTFIPFTIMITCSIIIIVRVAQQSKKFNKKPKMSAAIKTENDGEEENLQLKESRNRAIGEKKRMDNRKVSVAGGGGVNDDTDTSSKAALNSVISNSKSNEAKFNSRTRNLALMLIPVNLLFLAFLAPVVITMYTYDSIGEDKLMLAIVELLSYCNFTINFFIYFITSSKFREEFFKFLNETIFKNKQNSNSGNNEMFTTTNNHNNKTTVNQTSLNATTNGTNVQSKNMKKPQFAYLNEASRV